MHGTQHLFNILFKVRFCGFSPRFCASNVSSKVHRREFPGMHVAVCVYTGSTILFEDDVAYSKNSRNFTRLFMLQNAIFSFFLQSQGFFFLFFKGFRELSSSNERYNVTVGLRNRRESLWEINK